MAVQAPVYRFGDYELRPRQLLKQGMRVKLRPQTLQILTILVEYSGEVVLREELRRLLWSKETFVDFEHGLNTAIKELRAALNDSATASRYIETVPKVGYRIIVPVHTSTPTLIKNDVQTSPTSVSESPAAVSEQKTRRGHLVFFRRWLLLPGLAIPLVFAMAAYFRWWVPLHRSQVSGRMALAILPFENLTGDTEEDYLGDGLTEELISELGQLDPERLGVIAYASVIHYRNRSVPLEEIGRTLHVQYALTGSVRQTSGRLRVSSQLLDMNGQSLWSREYDREKSELPAIQREIAREISDEISVSLGSKPAVPPRAPAASNVPSEAYDLYLRGVYALSKRTVPSLQRAVTYFQEAVAKDPSYAPAYAALANSYALFGGYSGGLQTQYKLKAREAALRALELDGNLPEAHVALALIAQKYDWDWRTAGNEYRQAIRLNPNYATAHHWYAEHLAYMGRFDEAFAESQRAQQIDPLSLIIATDRGLIFYYSRRYDDAINQFVAVREMEPTFMQGGLIVYPQIEERLYPQVFSQLEFAHKAYGESAWYWAWMAYAYGRSGRAKEARNALEKVEALNQHQTLDPGILLWANLGMGNKKQTFFWMEKAYAQHSNILTTLKVDPAFDSLRGDPRFQAMLERVRLN
ncbi:MAG TPA: winged helix-turn-helix domain-containing protein [Terriglobales bacterium]|nr:winged helix-turn-helix domain-containing protein [Terriglobales bacterium]